MRNKNSYFNSSYYKLIFCLFIIIHSEGIAQTMNLNLEHVSGLSRNFVNCIFQDNYGFIWVGTRDGLSKYDGYNFTFYKHDFSNNNSENSYSVTDMVEGLDGTIWVGSRYGLHRFDPTTGVFTRYNQYMDHNPDKKDKSVSHLLLDKSGVLWVGTRHGLNRLDPATGSSIWYNHDSNNPKSLCSDVIKVLLEDASGRLWVGTVSGLNRYNSDTGDFSSFKNEPNNINSLNHNWVEDLLVDASGTLWVAAHNGLNKFDKKTETFTRYLFIEPNDRSDFKIRIRDSGDGLWILNHNKLLRFDKKTSVFKEYSITNRYFLRDSVLFIDQYSGMLWLGTQGWGLHKANINIYKFKHYSHAPDNPNSLSYPSVRGLYEDEEGVLWVGGYGGLNRIDRKTGTFSNYNENNSNILGNDVYSIYANPERDNNTLWIGLEGGGINKFNPETGEAKIFQHDPKDPESISSNLICAIFEDKNGALWFGTDYGLNRMDRKTEIFTHYLLDKKIEAITEDRLGFLWIGTARNGVFRFDTTTEQFKQFKNDSLNATSLNNNAVKSVFEDSSGRIWISTNGGGINRFDRETESFTSYTEKDGLPNNVVYGILEDGVGRLWLSTNYGLSCFDPELISFYNYHEQDGLQGYEFNTGSFYKSPQGELFFGGLNGFNAFFGENIVDNLIVPPVVFTNIQKLNKQFRPEMIIHDLEEIILNYKDRSLSLEFSVLDYISTEKNTYAYRLKGVIDQWVDLGSKREVTFIDLDPGMYTMEVKGANSLGVWNEEGISIQFKVLAPWWGTWWAYFLYGLTSFLFIISVIKYRTKTLRKRARILKQTVEDRTAKVVSTLNELKTTQEHLVQSEKMASLGVLTAGIAHEINNPINFISSGVHSLDKDFDDLLHILNKLKALPQDEATLNERAHIVRDLEEEFAYDELMKYIPQTISDIKEGVSRTTEIIKGLQLYSRSNELVRQKINIHESIDASLALLRDKYKNNIKIVKQYDYSIKDIEGFQGQLSQVFTNLIDNAIDAIENKGSIEITTALKSKQIEILIRDSGAGISEDNITKIFDPFFTTKEVGRGTGLGLSICQGIINNHGGTIKVKSKLKKGSEFIITLASNFK